MNLSFFSLNYLCFTISIQLGSDLLLRSRQHFMMWFESIFSSLLVVFWICLWSSFPCKIDCYVISLIYQYFLLSHMSFDSCLNDPLCLKIIFKISHDFSFCAFIFLHLIFCVWEPLHFYPISQLHLQIIHLFSLIWNVTFSIY